METRANTKADIQAKAARFREKYPVATVVVNREVPRIEYTIPGVPVQEGPFAQTTLFCADYFRDQYGVTTEEYLFSIFSYYK